MKNGFLIQGILAILTVVVVLPEADAAASRRLGKRVLVPRFRFNIDPKASFKELLPAAPKLESSPLLYPQKLADVPEIMFEDPGVWTRPNRGEAKVKSGDGDDGFSNMRRLAHTVAKVNHLNKHRPDYFMQLIRRSQSGL